MAFLIMFVAAVRLVHTVRRMGAVGLILLGLISSVAPLPGSVELVTILLAARHRDLWWYYAAASTLGTVLGGCIPYYLGWTGGTQLLARRWSQRQAEIWTRRLHSWGFGAIVFSGLLPPPLPSTPLLLAAGGVHYPRKRFVGALATGRGLRFVLIALLASIYRRRAVRLMNRALIPMMVLGVLASIGYAAWLWYQRWAQRRAEAATEPETGLLPRDLARDARLGPIPSSEPLVEGFVSTDATASATSVVTLKENSTYHGMT